MLIGPRCLSYFKRHPFAYFLDVIGTGEANNIFTLSRTQSGPRLPTIHLNQIKAQTRALRSREREPAERASTRRVSDLSFLTVPRAPASKLSFSSSSCTQGAGIRLFAMERLPVSPRRPCSLQQISMGPGPAGKLAIALNYDRPHLRNKNWSRSSQSVPTPG